MQHQQELIGRSRAEIARSVRCVSLNSLERCLGAEDLLIMFGVVSMLRKDRLTGEL